MKSTAACERKSFLKPLLAPPGASVKSEIASSDVPWDRIDWTEDYKFEKETNLGL